MIAPAHLAIAPEVADALASGTPVVALESTLISHGLAYPHNVEVATASEAAIRVGSADVEVLYPALLPYHDRICGIGQIACFGAAAHHLGVLAVAMGDDRRGAEHLRDAVATHRRLGLDAFTALSLAELSRLPRAFQEDDPVALRAEAAAIADAHGLGRVAEALTGGPTAA